jgi:tetratricopeptide (TPR) repeat protein
MLSHTTEVQMTAGARVLTIAVSFGLLLATPSQGQIPQKFENLQHFPKDIAQPALIQRMREFSFALNVRCQYCHAGGDGVSFEGVDFKSDEKIAKQKARYMLRMVDKLNAEMLAAVPGRTDPPVKIDCVHCHRGSATPRTLGAELTATIEKGGPDAAVARYRELRTNMASGRFDFTEWSMNELARSLAERGNTEAALAMLELNGEYYPKSAAIDFHMGELHRRRGEIEKAIARYRLSLQKDPNNSRVREALEQLEKR